MKKFDVNQIAEALEEKYKIKIASIEDVQVASVSNQWEPELKRVGAGGVLTVYCVEE